MMNRILLFSWIFFAVIPLFAREAKDVIVMKNGDRMTCEIKSLDRGTLSINLDYVDGTISVDWSKVIRLESTQIFLVLTEDGGSYEGTLTTPATFDNQPMKMEITQITGKKLDIERQKVVGMKESADKVWQRFNGALNFGVVYSKGNNATQYSFGADTQYLRERWAADADFGSNLSSNNGSKTSTRNQLGLRAYHLLPWDNYFYAGLGNFLQSTEQGIALQTTVGGGVGHFFKNGSNTSIAVLGGLGWQGTNYSSSTNSPTAQNVATALIGAEIKIFKFKKSSLNVSAILLPALSDPGRVHFDTNASYYLKLFSNLSWNMSFYGNWDNQPPHGFSGSDYGTSSGLSWTFGNR